MGFAAAVLVVLSVCGGAVASNPPAGAMNVFFIAVDGTSAFASAGSHPYRYMHALTLTMILSHSLSRRSAGSVRPLVRDA
jgi:hypothetical protein